MTKFEAALESFKANINLFTWDAVRTQKGSYAVDIMTNEDNSWNEEGGLNLVDYIVSDLDAHGCYYPYGKMPMYDHSKRQASFVRMVNAVVGAATPPVAPVFEGPTIIENKKGNTGFELTPWGTIDFNFTIDDLVKRDANSMSFVINEIKYRIREVEVQSCGKKQMTVTEKGEFIKRFLSPDTVLYSTMDEAVQVAQDKCAEGLKYAQDTAQAVIDDRTKDLTRYNFVPIGLARYESQMRALAAAKVIVDESAIRLTIEGGA